MIKLMQRFFFPPGLIDLTDQFWAGTCLNKSMLPTLKALKEDFKADAVETLLSRFQLLMLP